jgi:hypothetical protein
MKNSRCGKVGRGGTRMSGCGLGHRRKPGKVLVSMGTSKSDKQSTGNDLGEMIQFVII